MTVGNISEKYKFTHTVFNIMLMNLIHYCVFTPSLFSVSGSIQPAQSVEILHGTNLPMTNFTLFVADVPTVCRKQIQKRRKEVYSQQNSALYHSAGLQHLSTQSFVSRRSLWLSRRMSITYPKASHAVLPVSARNLSTHFIHKLKYMWTD